MTISGIRFGFDPKALFSTIRIPGVNMEMALTKFVLDTALISSTVIVFTDPVKLSFFLVKNPVTTTSSNALVSDFITTLYSVFFFNILNS